MATLRTLLVLGRVSNLPTVWSNCLAGWVLAGGGGAGHFALLCGAATAFYVGGMYLNDAFDAQFDSQHRPERPIPSGAIRVEAVWGWGFTWLGLGLAGLLLFGQFGQVTIIFGLLLSLSILVYDAVHKIFAFSPVLMAACRFFLLLVAASAGAYGISGHPTVGALPVWSALALAAYVVGLSYVARKESTVDALSYWPCLCLAVPLLLAWIVNWDGPWWRVIIASLILVVWVLRCLATAFWAAQRNIGRTVSGLLAGIPLVDWLAVWDGSAWMSVAFLGCFGLALLFQRSIPAT